MEAVVSPLPFAYVKLILPERACTANRACPASSHRTSTRCLGNIQVGMVSLSCAAQATVVNKGATVVKLSERQ
eukprot:6176529-Pleurochrysis_carterae.AAC.3